MTKRNTYHHGDLRQALINAALELIAENLESVSLREVARRVGVSHTAPYRHFADKDALLATVAEEGFQMLRRALETAMHQALSDPLQQLQAIGVAYVDFALKHSSHYRVMFGVYGATSAQQNFEAKDAARQTFMVLVSAIKAGQQANVMRSEDPQRLAWTAWSLVHGLAMLLMDAQVPLAQTEAISDLSSFITKVLIEGLAKTEIQLVS